MDLNCQSGKYMATAQFIITGLKFTWNPML